MTRTRILIASFVFLACFTARGVHAASLSVSTSVATVAPGDTFIADVRLDSEKQVVNAVQTRIQYDPQALTLISVSKADSALTLWTQDPVVDAVRGTVTFSGGIPNGSYILNARLLTLTFQAARVGSTAILLNENLSGVYLNDGLGTKTSLTLTPANLNVQLSNATLVVSSSSHPREDAWYNTSTVQIQWNAQLGAQYAYTFSQDPNAQPDTRLGSVVSDAMFGNVADGTWYFIIQEHLPNDQWTAPVRRRVNVDTTLPNSFTPQLTRDVVPGKLVLVFATTDLTSSIARWRVQEGGVVTDNVASPYVLHDQMQGQTIVVIAYDEAGNSQSATIAAMHSPATHSMNLWYGLIGGGVALVLVGGVVWGVRRRRSV